MYNGLHKEQNTTSQIYGVLENKEHEIIEQDHFSFFGALVTIISLVSYVLDSTTNVYLSYLLYNDGNPVWFGLTASITAFSAVTVNAFSIRWYLQDKVEDEKIGTASDIGSNRKLGRLGWFLRILTHILFVGPILRYIDLVRFGMRSHQERKRKAFEKQFQRDCHLSTLQPPIMTTLQRSNIPNLAKIANGNNVAINTEKVCLPINYY